MLRRRTQRIDAEKLRRGFNGAIKEPVEVVAAHTWANGVHAGDVGVVDAPRRARPRPSLWGFIGGWPVTSAHA
jgi:hypothetical protein